MGIWLTGDVHGLIKPFIYRIKAAGLGAEDTIILLGDNGLNFHRGWKDKNKKKDLTKKTECTYFVIRGNHDIRPEDYFNQPPADAYNGDFASPTAHYEEFWDNKVLVEDEFPNIKYAVDGLIYDIEGKKTLVIGGGYSVDKYYRLENGWTWVANEQLDETERVAITETFENNHVDIILSHVAPTQFNPYFQHMWMNPGEISGGWGLIEKDMEIWMNSLLWSENNTLEHWYFGHVHADMQCGEIGTMLYEAIIPFGSTYVRPEVKE